MRRMNSMFHGHHGASSRTDAHVALDRVAGRRVVPRQRQVHDTALDDRRRRARAARPPRPAAPRACCRPSCASPVDLHLQRADAGRDFDDARHASLRSSQRRERVRAEPQVEVERPSARTRRARPDRRSAGSVTCGTSSDAGRIASTVAPERRAASDAGAPSGDDARRVGRASSRRRHEAHRVAGRELTDLPPVGRRSP